MRWVLLIIVSVALFSLVQSQRTKPPPFDGAYIWGLDGNCVYSGGTCTYLPGSRTTCYPWSNCLEVAMNISHYADYVAVEIAGRH